MPGDGSCLVNAFDSHEHGSLDSNRISKTRKVMRNYTLENSALFPGITNPEQYHEPDEYLTEYHILSYHLVSETNIVLYRYCGEYNAFSRQYYYKDEFENKRACGLLFTRFSSGHYD
eukprot:335747_1